MAAGETLAALGHQLWFSGAKHLGIDLSIRETALEVIRSGSADDELHGVCEDSVESEGQGHGCEHRTEELKLRSSNENDKNLN